MKKHTFPFTGGVWGRAPQISGNNSKSSSFDDLFGAPCVSEREARSASANCAPCLFNKKMPPFEYNNVSAPYSITKDDLEFQKNKIALQATWLKSREFISENTGEIRSLFDFTMSANLSSKYFAEVNNRVNTLSDFMVNADYRMSFLTITLNGCWRDALFGDYSRFAADDTKYLPLEVFEKIQGINNKRVNIRDLVSVLNFQWHVFFKRVLKFMKKLKYFYIRVFEPHKNGVPHIHALISYPKEAHDKILKAFKDIFNAPQNLRQNHLSKEQKRDGEINGFQWTLRSPTGYVMKYIGKTFVNVPENAELNELQAWYIKYKVRRFTTSRHQVPLWIYRKINFFKKDFYDLCNIVNSDDWYCEWDYNNKYFCFENAKNDEKIIWQGGILEHTLKGVVCHRYVKKIHKPIHRKIEIFTKEKNSRIRIIYDKKPVNRMKDFELIEYFKNLPIQNTPHYALVLNELKKRGLNKIFGLDDKPVSLNNAQTEINPFDYIR